MFNDIVFTALGATKKIRKSVKKELKSLEKKGMLRKEDLKAFVDNLEAEGKIEDKKIKKEIRSMLKEVINELGLATKKDLQRLKVEILEELKGK